LHSDGAATTLWRNGGNVRLNDSQFFALKSHPPIAAPAGRCDAHAARITHARMHASSSQSRRAIWLSPARRNAAIWRISTMHRSFLFAVASVLAFAAIVAPAAAHTRLNESEMREVRVTYSDLDLSRTQGAAELLRRVNRASRQACGAAHGRVPLDVRAADRACMQAANDRAVAQINNPIVLGLYIERTGRNPREALIVANSGD
jgi:UrcA family protein